MPKLETFAIMVEDTGTDFAKRVQTLSNSGYVYTNMTSVVQNGKIIHSTLMIKYTQSDEKSK